MWRPSAYGQALWEAVEEVVRLCVWRSTLYPPTLDAALYMRQLFMRPLNMRALYMRALYMRAHSACSFAV